MKTPIALFIEDMTYSMFSDFWRAMNKRLKADEKLKLYLHPKDHLSDIEKNYCKTGEKIKAIKEFRSRTGEGLRFSKDAIDKFCLENKI
mgnify:CR=1 FL=1